VIRDNSRLDNILLHLVASIGDLAQAVVLFVRDASLFAALLFGEIGESLLGGYGGNGRALGEDLVGFEGLVRFVVGLLDGGGAGGVDLEEFFRGFLCDNTTTILSNWTYEGRGCGFYP
jgi:hypothetical protein